MKYKILPIIFFLSFNVAAKAAETEPNNTKAQANTLALNGSNTGKISSSTDVDWWKVTTTGDGKLNVTIAVSNGIYMWCTIYDNNGATVLNQGYTSGTTTVSKDGLAVGTYYLKVYPYYNGDLPAYTISNTLTQPAQANDTEPDSTRAQALTLPLNSSKTGHIGYYYNNHRDSADWYKVTTTGDGRLRLTIASANGQNVWAYLFDNNGKTQLAAGYTSGTSAVVNKDGLAAGTYYIRVNNYYTSEWAPYTISDSLFVPAITNDAEPDSTRAQALTLPLNGKKQGHIGYYYNNHKDSVDWYKVITTGDGRLRLTIASANSQNVWAYLFDNDGKTQLAAGYTSGTSVVVNKDGLAAGTYYIRVNNYYSSEWAPYTISDSLFVPAITNDTEPDSTRAQALTLPLNGNKQGHVGYYYNNHKDSVDWYKVTTNGDGRLRLTMSSANGQNVWAYLFDNDGKTQLAAGYTSGTSVVVNKDGLAAGTYYIRVNTYYNSDWVPYTISDSLFKPTQANDTEPNNSKVQALPLALNGSTTGHVNYYYNLAKDSSDWYKLTTNADGMITVTIQSFNGQNVWAYLFDNNGTKILASAYTTGTTSYTFDGLKTGTYYIKVNTYYNSEWAPYKLSNTLSTYSYADDSNNEPNSYFKQAKTVNSNSTQTGHVGFYYNGVSDAVDYYKINYTGTGNLTLSFTQNNRIKYGSPDNTWFQVYKDTAASPIYSNYFTSPSGNINFTGLAKGYYYLKVFMYYNGAGEHFSSYSIKNTYTQNDIATIAITSTAASPDCSALNSITYKLTKSHAPYKVQLYRFDSLYEKLSANGTVTFDSLPDGRYYAIVYGDGATGNAKDTSAVTTFMPVPGGLSTAAIKATEATLKWTALSCAKYFSIQYRKTGVSAWTTVSTNGNVSSYILKGLTAATNYEWKVAAVDSLKGIKALSAYSPVKSFKTSASLIADNEDGNADNISIAGKNSGSSTLVVAPNPARSYFIIKYNGFVKDKITATLYTANGKAVWNSGAIRADALNNQQVNVSSFTGGLYFLRITDSKGTELGNMKVAVAK